MPLVSYRLEAGVATVTMDDGKVNALSPAMLRELNAALDRAAEDRAVVLLTGRPGVFSAGFDLNVLRGGGPDAAEMVRAGFETAYRVLSFPLPVLMACTGHAVAMGLFLLESGDYLLGAAGPYRFTANEVAIGLSVPDAALAVLRQRLTPAVFNRMTMLAEPFTADVAVEAGLLDRLVEEADLLAVSRSTAEALTGVQATGPTRTRPAIDLDAHLATKLRARRATLAEMRAAIDDATRL